MYTAKDFEYPENITKDIPLLEEIKSFLKTVHGERDIELKNPIVDGYRRREQIAKIINEYENKQISELEYCMQICRCLCSWYNKSINECVYNLRDGFPTMISLYDIKSRQLLETFDQERSVFIRTRRDNLEKKAKHKQACQKGQRKSAEKKREYKEQVKNTYMSINEIENMCLKRAYDRLKSEHEKRYGVLHRKESTLYKWISEFEKEKSRIQNSSQNI